MGQQRGSCLGALRTQNVGILQNGQRHNKHVQEVYALAALDLPDFWQDVMTVSVRKCDLAEFARWRHTSGRPSAQCGSNELIPRLLQGRPQGRVLGRRCTRRPLDLARLHQEQKEIARGLAMAAGAAPRSLLLLSLVHGRHRIRLLIGVHQTGQAQQRFEYSKGVDPNSELCGRELCGRMEAIDI